MKSESITERDGGLLRSVASEYERKGYDVKLQPTLEDLPDFLAGFEPDLIATGNDETVVVEVKSRKELENDQAIAAIETALRDQPGWRFELIIDGSERERHPLGSSQIGAWLEEAHELQQGGHLVAALLLLWSATEGILRLLAARENVELESQAPGYLTTRLYTLGLLGREQYRILGEIVRLRNHAAHGFEVSVTRQDLLNVTAIARELLSELQSKAA